MTKLGFVASGGGYRSFYSAGALVWLRRQDIPVVHITSTSSGNNIVLDYLLWDWETEPLPPVLTQTLRLSFKDIFEKPYNEIARSLGKPILITEFGCADKGGDKARWIKEAMDSIERWPDIKGFILFNVDKEARWKFSAQSAAGLELKKQLENPYFKDKE